MFEVPLILIDTPFLPDEADRAINRAKLLNPEIARQLNAAEPDPPAPDSVTSSWVWPKL